MEQPTERGLRERGKAERLKRLRQAAATVFRERGYAAATTREIAQAADLGVGTLFTYARDKRDLLFLLVNDDLDEVLRAGTLAAEAEAPLLDQLLALLGPIYDYFASEPTLARPALREVINYDWASGEVGEQAARYFTRMANWQRRIVAVLLRAQRNGTLGPDEPISDLGRILWDVHLVEVRRWMSGGDTPVAERGRAELRRLAAVVLQSRLHSASRRSVKPGRE